MKRLLVLPLLIVCLWVAAPASADPIPGVFSTGAGLAPGQADANYGGFAVNTDSAWSTTDAVPAGSSWLSHYVGAGNLPVTPTGGLAPPATTTFQLNFSTAGFDLSTAQLSFKFSVDNNLEIKLNGNVILTTQGDLLHTPSVVANFKTLSSLVDISSQLISGANTLTFTVRNNELIEGLLVSIVSNNINRPSDIPGPLPEPTSIALWAMLSGLGTFAARWSRNNRKKSS